MDIEKLAFEALALRRADEMLKEAGLPKEIASGKIFKTPEAYSYATLKQLKRSAGKGLGRMIKEYKLPVDDPGVQLAIRVNKGGFAEASKHVKTKASADQVFEALAQQRALEMLKEAGLISAGRKLLGLTDEAAQAATRSTGRSAGRAAVRKPAFAGHEAVLPTQAKTVVNPRGVTTTSPHYNTLAKQQVKGTQDLTVPGWGMDRGAVSSAFGGVKA